MSNSNQIFSSPGNVYPFLSAGDFDPITSSGDNVKVGVNILNQSEEKTFTLTNSTVIRQNNCQLLENGNESLIIGNSNCTSMVTLGNENLVLGSENLLSGVSTDKENIIIGNKNLNNGSTGNTFKNVIIGNNIMSGFANNAALNNVCIGNDVSTQMTSGQSNVFIGERAALNNSSGSMSVAVGHTAGINCTTGSNCIFLGEATGEAGMNSATVIGNTAQKQNFIGGKIKLEHYRTTPQEFVNADQALTAAQILEIKLFRLNTVLTEERTWTLPVASDLTDLIQDVKAEMAFKFYIMNPQAGAFDIVIAGNTGLTLPDAITIASGERREILGVITDITPASEGIVIWAIN